MSRFFYLTPVLGGPGAPRYPITDERQLVGRSEKAHIALLEPTVSREHATVHSIDDEVLLEDLESKHGTYVNSKRISEKGLRVGDIVVFGLSLVLRLEESDDPLPPAPALAASGPDATVSLVDPPKRRRERDTGRSALGSGLQDPTITRVSPVPSHAEINRMRESTIRALKLATVGARAGAQLPQTFRVLSELLGALQSGAPSERDIAALAAEVDAIGLLLDDCQIARPELEPVELFDVTRQVVGSATPAANRRNVDLLLGVPAGISVLTDPARLRAALLQLLRNAASASPRQSAVEISASVDGDWATLTIVDCGPGIPPAALERIFDPFVTLSEDWQALGVGLFEARETIVALGGNLRLESLVGHGTTVSVTLPRG